MSDEKFISCQHQKKTKTDSLIVCSICGVVIEEELFVQTSQNELQKSLLYPELTGSTFVKLESASSRANKILHQLIDSICSKFSLPDPLSKKCKDIIDVAVSKRIVNRGRQGRKAIVVIIYFCANSDGTPITLTDLALLIHENPDSLFRSIDILKPILMEYQISIKSQDPALYLERLYSDIVLDSPQEKKINILRRAIELCSFAEERSLVEGRKADTVSLACLLLSMECEFGRKRTKEKNLQDICKKMAHSIDTLRERMNELRDALLECAKGNPLCPPGLSRVTVSLALEEILKYRDAFEGQKMAMPPSFVNSLKVSTDRKNQVINAQNRIMMESKCDGDDLSLDDLIIERLLLHGCDKDKIINTTNSSQLYDLEGQFFIEDDDELSSDGEY